MFVMLFLSLHIIFCR